VYKTRKFCDNARAGLETRTKIKGDPGRRSCQASPANSRSSNARERLDGAMGRDIRTLGLECDIFTWSGIFSAKHRRAPDAVSLDVGSIFVLPFNVNSHRRE
jgi:hypothetical protein